ncbi:MAG TPA: hypothetical protein VEF06_10525 [Bryobacteraceae bacterium]|nr:hypothetical protein [Bryobacteraceae bacterium]
MSVSPLSGNYLQQIALQQLLGIQTPGNNVNGATATGSAQSSDSNQLSPFAQLLNTLQQLQESNPTQYQQVTQQISTNLQSAAQTAQQQGNTSLANELNQLANDFSTASQTGQLPNISDLAQAVGGGHHHHHHHHASSSSSSSSDSDSSSSSQSLSQLFSAGSTQTGALNPLNIINATLVNAGITQ